MQSGHELVPEEFRGKPSGMYITFVDDGATAKYDKAKKLGFPIHDKRN